MFVFEEEVHQVHAIVAAPYSIWYLKFNVFYTFSHIVTYD